MELFSEIYGCYFTVVARILDQAKTGVTKAEIEELVHGDGFYDSTFHLLPSLFLDEWKLLSEKDERYYSNLSAAPKRPLTLLEKAWLKALLEDPRILLFINEDERIELNKSFADVQPLFEQRDFHHYDRHLDGDQFNDPDYISRFQFLLNAVKERETVVIEYDSGKGRRTRRQYHPYQLCYSARDNKFRLQCAAFNTRQNRLQKITLNLARITAVYLSEDQLEITNDLDGLLQEPVYTEPVLLEITTERNGLERCMLQFASFKRQTEFDRERGIYTCRIWYDPADETELLIRILSFGPVVKVVGPDKFLKQIKERIQRQIQLNNEPAAMKSTENAE